MLFYRSSLDRSPRFLLVQFSMTLAFFEAWLLLKILQYPRMAHVQLISSTLPYLYFVPSVL